MFRKVKALTGLPVEIHTHNDFGMGVATELAAVTAGAEVVHSCINGLGERTGKASITYALEKMGIQNVSDDTVAEILGEVKENGVRAKFSKSTRGY